MTAPTLSEHEGQEQTLTSPERAGGRRVPSAKRIIVGAGRLIGVYVGLFALVGVVLVAAEAIAHLLGFGADGRQIVRLMMLVLYVSVILSFTLRRRS